MFVSQIVLFGNTFMRHRFITGDNLKHLQKMSDQSVDLVFCSPPYEDARTYGIDFRLKGQEFVDWCVERYVECCRVSRGLVAWVIEGKTKQFCWSASPVLLMADLHRRGVKLRKPIAFHRVGIPGSGGPDWLRNDWEFVVCATPGKLPWSDNTACGHPPKWGPGGSMSNRRGDGSRVNQWGHSIDSGATVVDAGGVVRSKGRRKSHTDTSGVATAAIANPGNAIEAVYKTSDIVNAIRELTGEESDFQKHIVGGGVMGHKIAHQNEAPFPLSLAEVFIKSFCPPGGTVLDPFAGSGTVMHAAEIHGRNSINIDIRKSQIQLMKERLADISG